MNLRINKEKNIGSVVFIVEGDKDESLIIKEVFNKIFNYRIINYDKRNNKLYFLESKVNKYSKVFIIPAEYSAISKLDINDDYYCNLFSKLSEYGLDVENYPIYFLFDRDRLSNRPGSIEHNMKLFSNSRDNGKYRNGLFLISYPSIESFICSSTDNVIDFKTAKEIKQYVKEQKLDIKDLNENKLNLSIKYLIDKIYLILKRNISKNDFDSFENVNIKIFNFEEKKYIKEKKYTTLSLFLISCLDLGIIEILE